MSVYHADGLAGSHVVVVGVPPLEFWVLAVLQDVLLTLEVGVVVADPGAALHTDGVHPKRGSANIQHRYELQVTPPPPKGQVAFVSKRSQIQGYDMQIR